MKEEKTLADQLFNIDIVKCGITDKLDDILPKEHSTYTYDYYDCSIEIYNINRDLLAEELQKIWDFGFWQIWTHSVSEHKKCYVDAENNDYHPNPNNIERHYGKG